jgi:S-DNA-T family DNA segregation ATPase FtsK/SpoIIIE
MENIMERDPVAIHATAVRPTPRAPQPQPQRAGNGWGVRLLDLLDEVGPVPPVTAFLGRAEDGGPLLLRLVNPEVAHVLVAGSGTGGAGALMRAIAISLALRNRQAWLQVVLLDLRGQSFTPLAALPHLLLPIVQDADRATDALEWLVETMQARRGRKETLPHIVIFVDELAELVNGAGQRAAVALHRLLQHGHEAGIHLIAATQRPAAPALSTLLHGHFPVRLVGRLTSAEEAQAATGRAQSGAEQIHGYGEFIAVAAGRMTRFQAAGWMLEAGV